ncbi:fluoride efflux transporter FluC [Secundilactobacillus kimchicus]|uniref:fluoride efflux transporter FluC n=1 Tax=Secundilactobacillus kimchicus TaxID=528209 RepID=UPI0024A80D17|nr:CrcB family protein [Secundilactobacillus kimchicus]
MVMNVIVMSLAGTVGAVLRYGVTRAGNVLFKTVRLPVATLVINLVGAFCLGLAVSHLNSASLSWQLSSGFLAGFTTFSTFTNEVVTLHKKRPSIAFGYFVLSSGLGVAAAAVGLIV